MDGLDLKQTTTIGSLNERPSHQGGAGPTGAAAPEYDPELLAARVARSLDVKEILDVSSTRARFEAAFADHSIVAKGFELHAGETGGTAVDFPAGPWDLIVCIDTLERLSSKQSDAVIATLCANGDRVLVSTGWRRAAGPANPIAQATLAAAFAQHGFFHCVDLDGEFAETGTLLFERDTPSMQDIVRRYEQALGPLIVERADSNSVLPGSPVPANEIEANLHRQIDELRHQTLTSRDFAIGAEAEIARLQADCARFKAALDEVYGSTSWLVIRRGVAPLGQRLKRLKRIGSRSR